MEGRGEGGDSEGHFCGSGVFRPGALNFPQRRFWTSCPRWRLQGQVDYFRYKPTMRTERRRDKHNAYFVPYLSRLTTGQRMRT